MALFLKYRPQTFAEIVGQQAVRRTLQNALKAEKPAHAYLFSGSRGTGKTSTARIFAKGLNCEDLTDGNPCGKCRFCEQTAAGSLVDVIEIDAASNRGIDEIRDLREKINFSPNVARRKVYIIDEVHMLTKEAFNALLKTLEEPPDHAFFCLATTEIHKIPETILSRCQVFMFQRFSLEQLADRLQYICDEEGYQAESEALDIISRKAEGGMRDAISLLEQLAAELDQKITAKGTQSSLGISSSQTLGELFRAIKAQDAETGLALIKTVAQNGQDFRTFGHDFLGFLRAQMFDHLKDEHLPLILQTIEEFEKALSRLKTSPIIELPFEIAIVNLTTGQRGNGTSDHPTNRPTEQQDNGASGHPIIRSSDQPTNGATEQPNNEPTEQQDSHATEQSKEASNSTLPTTSSQPVAANSDLTPQAITKQMAQIVEKSGIPIWAKKSFLTTIPEVNGQRVVFYTDSEFHREKLVDSSIHNKLLGACKDVFKVPDLTIDFVKKTGMSAPKAQSNASVDDFLAF